MFDLTGKIAVVTGAASGIGAAAVRRFAAAGATVVLADINDASDIASEVGGTYVRTDVSVEEDVRTLMATAATIGGKIDICVNNAGISVPGLLRDAHVSDYERSFRVHTLGALFGIKHASARMPPGSAIVNTVSILGVIGYPACGAYIASKFAVIGLTKTAAIELGAQGIRVNCVCPTSVNTAMLAAQDNRDSEVAVFQAMASHRNLIEPHEVAAAMHFLVADDCPVISGHAMVLDGGLTAGVSPAVIEFAEASLLEHQ
jgi:3alpha(or 20beta)-hydroxysteroid dehydrogenase